MTVFSFHPVKTVTTGEGGAITVRDPELRERLLTFRTHGMTKDPARLERPDEGGWYMEQQALGFNYRITDIQCALGLSQLGKLERFVAARNAIVDRYREGLAGIEGLRLPPEPPAGVVNAHHLFVVEVERAPPRSTTRCASGRSSPRSTTCRSTCTPGTGDTYGYAPGLCPAAEAYYARCLSLPCFPGLTEAEQDTVIAALRDVL